MTHIEKRYDHATGAFFDESKVVYAGNGPSTLDESGTITDFFRRGRKPKWDVHPCTHTKTKVKWDSLAGANMTIEELAQVGSLDVNRVYQQHEPMSYFQQFLSSSFFGDSFITGASAGDYTASTYVTPDWFALVDSFREACDSFVPSEMMLGETIIEYGLFADLIKIAVNPTRAIPLLIKAIVGNGLYKKNLGTARKILLGSSQGTLTYNFAIKPAISDIKAIFSAHDIVSKRFDYLAKNGGSFVPVRVKKKFPSTISNVTLPNPNLGNSTLRKQCDVKVTDGVISGWGRVREGINYNELWKAYITYFGLNKVVGLAWELIPCSFLVDWVFNVQERINFLTRPSVGESPFTEFKAITASTKNKIIETVYFVPGRNPVSGLQVVSPNSPSPIFQVEKSVYTRFTKIPETSGVVDTSALGLFHGFLGGALLFSRILK